MIICLEWVSSVGRVVEAIAVPAVVIGRPEKIVEIARGIVIDVDVAEVWRDHRANPLTTVIVPLVIVEQHVTQVDPESRHELLEVDALGWSHFRDLIGTTVTTVPEK